MLNKKRAYAAGFFDGEGSVGIFRYEYLNYRNQPPPYNSCKVEISNTNKIILQWFQKNYGGAVRQHNRKNVSEKWKPLWRWRLGKQEDIQDFVISILPYSKVKKPQLELTLAFLKKEIDGEEAYLKLRELNFRGNKNAK
jgi:hypothetical protein